MSKAEAAEKLKEKGNEFFKKKLFSEAIECYSEAIGNYESAVYYSNRALCHIKLENYGAALEDADKSIELDPKYLKGYYRRGTAHIMLVKFKMALKDFKIVLKNHPKEKKVIKRRVQQCIREIKRLQFEKAIESDRSKSASESVDFTKMSISTTYEGPSIDVMKPNSVTREYINYAIDRLEKQLKLEKQHVTYVLLEVLNHLKKLPSLYDVNISETEIITVCGDTHGQFYDTMNIFKLNGFPSSDNPYVFNGDFVDRGSFSFENVFSLFAFKAWNPNCIHLTRGNHESRQLNSVYGFENEVKKKYGSDVYELFQEVFNSLPLCCLINKKILVLHGGVGFERDDVTLDDLRKIPRFRGIPDKGLMSDILWSDPQYKPGRSPSKRGVSVNFGEDVATNFMNLNGLELIIRSHEMKMGGYEEMFGGKLITVFSCPNYCDQAKNKGAYIKINGKDLKPKFHQFDSVPHPVVQSFQKNWF